jgi:hypothetical protein
VQGDDEGDNAEGSEPKNPNPDGGRSLLLGGTVDYHLLVVIDLDRELEGMVSRYPAALCGEEYGASHGFGGAGH